jgi:hypothetical protein
MRPPVAAIALACLLPAAPVLAQAQTRLSPADETAAFRAAGFKRIAGKWQGCGDPGTASYQPGAIETVRDINGDGRPDAVITEGSTYCFGGDENGFSLVSKQADGTWKLIASESGVATILPRRAAPGAAGGWPDIEIGGPGFCFPVQRWTGSGYATYRYQYEGKPCRPQR